MDSCILGPPRRFLFVVEYYYPHIGGLEVLFQNLAEGLVAAGHTVTVVTLRPPGMPIQERYNGVEIIRITTPRWASRYWFMLLAIPIVLRLARTADLIHTTTYNAALPAWLASALRHKPAVITVLEVFAEQWNNLPGLNPWLGFGYRSFEWVILHLPFSHYLCISCFTQGRLVRYMHIPAEKTSVVYPAIDYDFWDPQQHRPRDLKGELNLTPDTFLYLYFGRPGISKGIEYLLEAIRLVRARLPISQPVLLLSPDPSGPYQRVQNHIQNLGIADSVIILPPVPRKDLPGHLLAADCVVVPSISEGFGYAAAEATLMGCPVVATSGHAVEEVLGPAVRLVPPRDPQALADAIIAVAHSRPEPTVFPRRYDIAAHIAGVQASYAALLHKLRGSKNAPDASAKLSRR